jgi:hypothetical protein
MAASGTYTVHADAQTISTAITILELTAPATGMLEIVRAWCQQSSTTTSNQVRIQLLRKSGTITGTATPPSAVPHQVGQQAWDGTVKWKATAEGTDGVIPLEENFNILNGWLYLPVPDERVWVPPSGIIALKFPAAPPSASWSYGITFRHWA